MKKIICIALGLAFAYAAQAQIPSGYYTTADGLTGLKLKHELSKIISAHHISWNYSHLPAFYPDTDSDHYYENDGTMLDIYSENPSGPDPYTYDWATVSLISGASEEGLGYNREHILSQSFFYGCYPMYSDLHFVVPTDARVNQRRSNLPFGKVGSSTSFLSMNGTKVGLSTSPGYTLTVFEPIDEFKGDIARMLLYAAVRYEGLLNHFDTTNTRNPFHARTEAAVRPWLLAVLRQWHIADPVSDREIGRNNAVYEKQGNRNPFIDHPEYVELIWGNGSDDSLPPDVPVYLSSPAAGSKFISLSWEPAHSADLLGYEISVNGEVHARVRDHHYVLTHLNPSTSYTIAVRSYDEHYNFSAWSLSLHAATLAEDTFAHDLMFSKIIEGTGNNKAIEIQNHTGYTVDLSEYTIGRRQVNFSTDDLYWSSNELRLEGRLEHGRSLVILHPEAGLDCLESEDADILSASTPLEFDGRLALRLRYKGTTIDMFGRSGNREPFAVDKTMYRKSSVRQPNTSFITDEWETHPINYCEGLGADRTGTERAGVKTPYDIYPNPVRNGDNLYIKLSAQQENVSVSVINSAGHVFQTFKFKQTDYIQIPVAGMAPGVYLLQINESIKKIIVTN